MTQTKLSGRLRGAYFRMNALVQQMLSLMRTSCAILMPRFCLWRRINFPFWHCFIFRHLSELTEENLKHLEKVFRENLAKDKEEFTLSEFKKIVPSKNVSINLIYIPFKCSSPRFTDRNSKWKGHWEYVPRSFMCMYIHTYGRTSLPFVLRPQNYDDLTEFLNRWLIDPLLVLIGRIWMACRHHHHHHCPPDPGAC